MTNDEKWYEMKDSFVLFIEENKRRPLRSSKNKMEKTLAYWINANNQNYKKKTKCIKIEDIYIDEVSDQLRRS